MKNILISFIIPCFHSEKTIQRAVDSIYNQFKDKSIIEIVLCAENEGDTTKTGLVDSFKRCRWCFSKEPGVTANRNTGLREAKGEYVYFLDSDDELYQNKENVFLKLINEYPDIDVFFGRTKNFNDECDEGITRHLGLATTKEELDSFYGDFGIVNYSFYSYLFKTSFLVNNECFVPNELTNYEDYYFVGMFLTKMPRMLVTNKTFCIYTISSNSLSKNKSINSCVSGIESFSALIDLFNSSGFADSLFRFKYTFVSVVLDCGIYLNNKDKKKYLAELKRFDIKKRFCKSYDGVSKKGLMYRIFGFRFTWFVLKVVRKIKGIK